MTRSSHLHVPFPLRLHFFKQKTEVASDAILKQPVPGRNMSTE